MREKREKEGDTATKIGEQGEPSSRLPGFFRLFLSLWSLVRFQAIDL